MTLERHEEAFVKALIRRERRQRYLFLLADPKRRERLRKRFPHYMDWDLDPRYMHPVPAAYTYDDIRKYLMARGAGDHCHVVSYDSETDGTSMGLGEAIERTSFGCGSILCCVPGRLAYCAGEFGDSKFFLEHGARSNPRQQK